MAEEEALLVGAEAVLLVQAKMAALVRKVVMDLAPLVMAELGTQALPAMDSGVAPEEVRMLDQETVVETLCMAAAAVKLAAHHAEALCMAAKVAGVFRAAATAHWPVVAVNAASHRGKQPHSSAGQAGAIVIRY